MSSQKDRIIEIGAIKVINNHIVDSLSILVNPGIPVPYYATKVNGITSEMLENEISDIEGIKKFMELVTDDCYIVAHNVNFDIGFINAYLIRLGQDSLKNKLVDTIHLAKKAFPGRNKYSLGIIANELGIDVMNAHRAEDDTRVCYELYTKSINKLIQLESK